MPRILLIDSYDSFTFNLSTLIEKVTNSTVVTIRNDSVEADELVNQILPLFDAVVVGPGPGSPDNPADIGVLPILWQLHEKDILPVFGVCLGFQSMVLGFGGQIFRLKVIKHGQPGRIHHSENSFFEGLPQDFPSIRYHSLHAKCRTTTTGNNSSASIGDNVDDVDDILPLAWLVSTADDHEENVLMAGKHRTKPFFGVQYHPESICSEYGADVVLNFWNFAQKWSLDHNRIVDSNQERFNNFKEHYSIKPEPLVVSEHKLQNGITQNPSSQNGLSTTSISYKTLEISSLAPSSLGPAVICDEILGGKNFVLLNSASEPGRWTIIGILEPGKTNVITNYIESPSLAFISKWASNEDDSTPICDTTNGHELGESTNGIWGFLAKYMAPKIEKFRSIKNYPTEAPFIGGLVGYFSYEASSLNMIPGKTPLPVDEKNQTNAADVSLVDIERSILIDNKNNLLYAVSLDEHDNWVDDIMEKIKNLKIPEETTGVTGDDSNKPDTTVTPTITMPDKSTYISKIEDAKEYLRSGDSYELCLTAQTKLNFPHILDPWKLYKILLKRNPAPYSCFLNLPDSVLVGSSPERFMSWNKYGLCEFRPIKGTVRKGPHMTRAKAESILNTPKELGENLMIVDLIRHDLNQILSDVRAEKLMSVEEYQTVYQLVSVIQGNLPSGYLGIDVLSHSLPPGSMTGAPKLRSVEILHKLEDQIPRGIYSGVSGYWSVQDQGDWSVIIRSAYLYKNDPYTWRIGAGGAITILSDAEEEWEEMKTKLQTALQAFVDIEI